MTEKPSKQAVLAWARLLKAERLALARVEAALKQAGLPPLAWYDVLLELERAGETGMRPFELDTLLAAVRKVEGVFDVYRLTGSRADSAHAASLTTLG